MSDSHPRDLLLEGKDVRTDTDFPDFWRLAMGHWNVDDAESTLQELLDAIHGVGGDPSRFDGDSTE